MKRIIVMLLAAAMLLSLTACGKQPEETTPVTQPTMGSTEAPTETTTAPTEPTEPEWEPGTIRASGLGVLWKTYQRGDTVTVIGAWDDYYIIQDPEADHLVASSLVRLAGEELYEEQTGYARYGTQVYSTAYLEGEAVAALNQNAQVQVLDCKSNWMYIQWDQGTGYVSKAQISQWPISTGGSGSSDQGGGGGGGGSGSQDGSDVNLGDLSFFGGDYQVELLGAYAGPQYEKQDATEATILSDGTEGYLTLLDRSEEVKVTQAGGEECTIWLDGIFAKLPRWAVTLAGEEPHTPWEAYAVYGTKAYLEYRCLTEQVMFYTNQRTKVVDQLTEAGLYVIELEDGTVCYTAIEGLRETPVYQGSSGSSDDGGGSSGGGGGEWTPPVL